MDVEEFDRVYPSPAHAAAAELRDRDALSHPHSEGRNWGTDSSGKVLVAFALAATLFAGIVYIVDVGKTPGPPPAKTNVEVLAAAPTRAQFGPSVSTPSAIAKPAVAQVATATPAIAKPEAGHSRLVVASARNMPVAQIAKPMPVKKGSSGWILDPLSGDALAAALVIDKQRTIELNAQQLGKLARDDNRSSPAADAAGNKEPGRS